jgi:hypothetical protein
MSIKCLQTIIDENAEYKKGDIITNITRESADRLIKLKVAIKVDDKFKRNTKDLRKVYANRYKRNKFGGFI